MKILKGIVFTIALLTIILLLEKYVLLAILPWWKVVLVTIVAGIWSKARAWESFLMGFLAIAFWWGLFAFLANDANGGILASRIGNMMGGMSSVVLLLATVLTGGLTGGLGAILGAQTRRLLN